MDYKNLFTSNKCKECGNDIRDNHTYCYKCNNEIIEKKCPRCKETFHTVRWKKVCLSCYKIIYADYILVDPLGNHSYFSPKPSIEQIREIEQWDSEDFKKKEDWDREDIIKKYQNQGGDE